MGGSAGDQDTRGGGRQARVVIKQCHLMVLADAGIQRGLGGIGWSLRPDARALSEEDWRREVMLALGCDLSWVLSPSASMWLGFFATWWPQGSVYV